MPAVPAVPGELDSSGSVHGEAQSWQAALAGGDGLFGHLWGALIWEVKAPHGSLFPGNTLW